MDQSSLGISRRILLDTKSNSSAEILKAYETYIVNAAIVLRDAVEGLFDRKRAMFATGADETTIIEDAKNLIAFEKELAKVNLF